MKIAGLQKTTLVDYPGKIACVIFLYGCNFRCGFCYNPSLVVRAFDKGFSEKEILNFLKKRKEKLEAVCITGGEPLIDLDFEFVRKVKEMGYLVKIDTNGSFPDKLKKLLDEGLADYVAMDIKGCKEDYSKIAGVSVDLKKIEESIKLVNDFGKSEFRTTVVGKFHDADKIVRLGKWVNEVCGGRPKKYFLQGFQNNGDFVDGSFKDEKNVGERTLKDLKKVAEKYFEEVELRV